MADDWQDEAADTLVQRGGDAVGLLYPEMSPVGEADTDLPMRPPIDPQARRNMDEYFRQQRIRSNNAASARAVPSDQLLPPDQRRSAGVDVQPHEIYAEIPDRFIPSSPSDVGQDIRDNPHTEEYIRYALNNMLEGHRGVGDVVNAPAENAGNPMARQLGMRDLNKMTNNDSSLQWLFQKLAEKYGYSQAIQQMNNTLNYGFDHERYRDKMSRIPLSRPPAFEGMAQ